VQNTTAKEKTQRLCPKSLPNHYIVHYIVTMPFCSGVRMFSDYWCSLYSALNVSHNSPRNVVNIWWSLTRATYPIMQRFAFAAGWEWVKVFFLPVNCSYSAVGWQARDKFMSYGAAQQSRSQFIPLFILLHISKQGDLNGFLLLLLKKNEPQIIKHSNRLHCNLLLLKSQENKMWKYASIVNKIRK